MKKLPPLHVGQGSYAAGLTVFPVWVDAPSLHGMSWNPSRLTVAEREGSPVVEELVVESTSARPLVALEGDLLEGGWQNRMLARSILMAPRESRVMEVLCVEHGRWSGAASHQSRGRRGSPSVRFGNDSQREVWNRIGRYEVALGATASSSILDYLDRSEGPQLHLLSGQRGVFLGVGGRIIGAEVFGSSRGLTARWDGMLNAAALDAHLAPQIATPAEHARRFARRLSEMQLDFDRDAGMARQLRSERRTVRLTGIATDVSFIYFSAFDETHPLLETA